ncbi:MAG: presenilin family intramembrane aspartyl protease [Nanoarchaeota archaeon]
MKHSIKITLILLGMFLVAQFIGLFVVGVYSPEVTQIEINGTAVNQTSYNLPLGLEPPQDTNPKANILSIVIAFFFAIVIMLILMNFKAELILRFWFFLVIIIALILTLNAGLLGFTNYALIISVIIAIPLAYLKVFQRDILLHNITELLIYPGIAAIFVPLLNIWTTVSLLILISIYDMYAVWHAKFMQKMAKYQINQVKVFSGFFIPYLLPKDKIALEKAKKSKLKNKKIKMSVAILGGGDVIFPIILAGAVLNVFGLLSAIIISLGATVALAILFHYSEKGKFYPAMPFISAGCFIALGIVYLIN